MKLLLIALLLTAPLADDTDLVKAAKKKPAKGVITNDVVKKNATPSGKSTAKAAAPPLMVKSDEQIQAEQKLLRDAADVRLRTAEESVATLEREMALVEQSYYAENDPDVRDRDITAKFAATKQKLAAAKAELAAARDEVAKLKLKNVIVHE